MNSAIPTVVFEVKDAIGNEVTAVNITMDGVPLVDHLDGSALELDPGNHAFTFEGSDGQLSIRRELVIHEGIKNQQELVEPPRADRPPEKREMPNQEPASHTRRTIGFILGGAGLVALGFTAYYQITALGRSSDSDAAAASSDPAVQATSGPIHDQAVQAQTYAIVTGVGGLLAIGTGIVLVLTDRDRTSSPAPRSSSWWVAPNVGLAGAGFAAGGAW